MSDETNQDTPAVDAIPEVAGEIEAPVDPLFVGTLDPQEMAQLASLRHRGTQLTMEIGNIEVRKSRLLEALDGSEKQAQQILNTAAHRLGLPDGQRFQVAQDGSVRLLGDQPQMS